jgi:hypothetical protein
MLEYSLLLDMHDYRAAKNYDIQDNVNELDRYRFYGVNPACESCPDAGSQDEDYYADL